eukprot:TRINITY_DN27071_c0_g2_i2.p1 TRINITY_DN27071_c0_g2~~TRINITY_DN27071_c0_g2_i2.p1  ORF type:complete len:529 (-),score=49.25 TRINITY_DN27071_c0_g2_i2:121-1638(-)
MDIGQSYSVNILVDGRRLQKHRNEFGEYVLSTPDVEYEIELLSLTHGPAVVETFVDGHSALCPPHGTRHLTSSIVIRGFEKRRIYLETAGDAVEESFEFKPFVFSLPSTHEDRCHPELGLIRVCFYEPNPIEVRTGPRGGRRGEIHEPSVQPRQGKKAHASVRLTTKEGDARLTRPHALSADDGVRIIYVKGNLMGELELRYYNGLERTVAASPSSLPGRRLQHRGGRLGDGPRHASAFPGGGNRLGGAVSRDVAIARLINAQPQSSHEISVGAASTSNGEDASIVDEGSASGVDMDDDMQLALQLSLLGNGAPEAAQSSSSNQAILGLGHSDAVEGNGGASFHIVTGSEGSSEGQLQHDDSRPGVAQGVGPVLYAIDIQDPQWEIEREYSETWVGDGSMMPTASVERVSDSASSGVDGASASSVDPASHANSSQHTFGAGNSGSGGGLIMHALAAFDGSEYGYEYLNLQVGDILDVEPGLDQGWAKAFSRRLQTTGWYPPSYAR